MPTQVHALFTSIVFRLVVFSVVFLLQWLVYRSMRHWWRTYHADRRWIRRTLTTLFLVFNLAFVVLIILRPHVLDLPDWFRFGGVYPFMIWYATTFFLGLILLVVDIVKFPFRAAFSVARRFDAVRSRWSRLTASHRYQQFNEGRRQFLRRSMEGTTAVVFGSTVYGVFIGRYRYEIDSKQIALPTLDPSLDGLSITLVSDIHSSVFMTRREMDNYVELINGMNSDIIVVPGDFVNSLTEEVYPFAESFKNLRAPHGVFGVTGNHDYYASDPARVIHEVEQCGIHLLHDTKTVLRIGGAPLTLMGVDDVGTSRKAYDRFGIAKGEAVEGASILLCHRPYFLPQASAHGIDLVLSGHTHGGQIVLASIGNISISPAALASPYVWGEYAYGKTKMYVSRGIGTVGIPVRFNCPPELTRIILRAPRKSLT